MRVRGCRHAFCEPCLHRWLSRSRFCPVCKLELAPADAVPAANTRAFSMIRMNVNVNANANNNMAADVAAERQLQWQQRHWQLMSTGSMPQPMFLPPPPLFSGLGMPSMFGGMGLGGTPAERFTVRFSTQRPAGSPEGPDERHDATTYDEMFHHTGADRGDGEGDHDHDHDHEHDEDEHEDEDEDDDDDEDDGDGEDDRDHAAFEDEEDEDEFDDEEDETSF